MFIKKGERKLEKLMNPSQLLFALINGSSGLRFNFYAGHFANGKNGSEKYSIGLAVMDDGEMGAALADALQSNAPEWAKLTPFDSIEELEAAMDKREVYGVAGSQYLKIFQAKQRQCKPMPPKKQLCKFILTKALTRKF